MREFTTASPEIARVYNLLSNSGKKQFGLYRKTIFHIHTPASYDYRFLERYSDEKGYIKTTEHELFQILLDKGIIPKEVINVGDIIYDKSIFSDLKEYLTYFLIADRLVSLEIEMVVITDHNTIDGFEKLTKAVMDYKKFKYMKKYPEIICGIEISCADKNHIVGIFHYTDNLGQKINNWKKEYVLSEKDGTYLPSVDVLKQINMWGGIGYIAHIDTSDIFKEHYLSKAYKETLFAMQELELIGVSAKEKIDFIKNKLENYAKREFNFVVDDDSHCLEKIGEKVCWIRGESSSFGTIKKAVRDYNIAVELDKPAEPDGYIRGLLVKPKQTGFLSGKDGKDEFIVTFSSSLNCFIGGRGVGKSTVLQILDFVLGQNYTSQNSLEIICNNEKIWVLYTKEGRDYLILLNIPKGKYDNVEDVVKQMQEDLGYIWGECPHIERERFQRKYMQIFRLKKNRDELEQKEISNVTGVLSSFFDIKYSVNELVQYADTKEISDYVKSTIFKNNKIKPIKNIPYVRTIKGLKEKNQLAKTILAQRKEEMQLIIDEYNKLHKNDIQIIYEINKRADVEIIDFHGMFGFMYSDKKKWFKGYNITYNNIVEYFKYSLHYIGYIEFIDIIVSGKLEKVNEIVPIANFTEEMKIFMVEQGMQDLSRKECIESFFQSISNYFCSQKGISIWIKGLRDYMSKCETCSLLFNINNREDIEKSKPIFKSTDKLSMGQKVVAMLSFVLSYSDFSKDYRPLLIDQPEDNLDNKYVYKNLVNQLREVKSKRQVIIATHSATIVTNAKADQVIVMESNNKNGWIRASGYPNEKRIIKHIINNLEGGNESFQHKCFIYSDVINKKKDY